MTASHSSVGHVDEHAVAQDPGVVDEDVEPAEGVDGGVDEPLGALPIRDVVAVGHRLAAHGADLVDHLAGGTGRAAGAVHLGAEVVDDDLRPLVGKLMAWPRPMPRPAPVTMTTRPSQMPVTPPPRLIWPPPIDACA